MESLTLWQNILYGWYGVGHSFQDWYKLVIETEIKTYPVPGAKEFAKIVYHDRLFRYMISHPAYCNMIGITF